MFRILGYLFRRRRADADLDEELQAHLAIDRQQRIEEGEPPKTAHAAALKDFGNILLVKELTREMWGWNWIEQFGQDARYAFRMLWRSPAFTLAAVLSLGLGIGANTAIFQLLEAVRLRSLPVRNPHELVEVQIRGEGRMGNFRGRNGRITYPIWEQLMSRQTSLNLFAWGDTPINVSRDSEVRNVEGIWVSGSFFPVLGVQPALGRLFTPADDRLGCGYPGAVISHAFWQREFGGSPDILSKMLPMGAQQSTPIIGVTPPEFFGLEVGRRFDVALPICSMGRELDNRMLWFLTVMGRVRPGHSLRQAEAELTAKAPGVFESTVPPFSTVDQNRYRELKLQPQATPSGVSTLRDSAERPLLALMAMVVFVLLIACLNVANMMLARATARRHEFGVRLSLGASRGRVLRQLMTEGLLLACLGGALGVGLASALTRVLVAQLATPRDPIFLDLGLDWRILVFTAGISALATILFGVAPSLRAGNSSIALRSGGRPVITSRGQHALRKTLLMAQVALCLVLVVSALLFVQSFRNLLSADFGFQQENVLVANTIFNETRYPVERRCEVYRSLGERLRAIPGVMGVSRSYVIPVSGSGWDRMSKVAVPDGERSVQVFLSSVGSGYFEVMTQPLLAGRDFSERDTSASPKVMIVNEEYARRAFAGANPIGKIVRLQGPQQPEPAYEIVGMVKNSIYGSPREERRPIAFVAADQEERPRLTVRYVLKSAIPPESLTQAVKQVLARADPELSLRFAVLKKQIEESLIRERLLATLSGFFGLLAVTLAVIGLYGVVSYMVAQRRQEIGLRMALGADRGGILRLILGEVGVMLGTGLAAGSVLALAAGRGAQTLLFGLQPHDPVILISAVTLLGCAGMAAGYIPARRATAVSPVDALQD